VPYDLEITAKRIQILSENMKKRGAKIVPLNSFDWNYNTNGHVMILAAKKMPYEVIY